MLTKMVFEPLTLAYKVFWKVSGTRHFVGYFGFFLLLLFGTSLDFFRQNTLCKPIIKKLLKTTGRNGQRKRPWERAEHFYKTALFTALRFSSWDKSGSAAHTGLEKSCDTYIRVIYNMDFMLSLSRHGHEHARKKEITWWKGHCSSSGPTALICSLSRGYELYLRIVSSEGLPCVEVHEAVEGIPRL